MAKYIELIDKYRIEQGESDYNPPSYVWVDNTGEIVRCRDCKHYNAGFECLAEGYGIERDPDWFCADGEMEVQE